MVVCLQGGGEFSAGCRAMDASLLAEISGPVVVTGLAAPPGQRYRASSAAGVAHFQSLGTEATMAPDVREHPNEALAVLRDAALIVLPGGSPSELLAAVMGTPLGALLLDHVTRGGAVMGASAGAMVLCDWTVLPDRPGGPVLARGLGVVVRLLVVPHWSGPAGREAWLRAVEDGLPEEVAVLGLPEESGVLLTGGAFTAVGQTHSTLVRTEQQLALGSTWRSP